MADRTLTQDGRWLKLSTPLGTDVVVADEMEGREEISGLFRFRVGGVASRLFAPSELLGEPISLSVARYAGSERTFHGVVTSQRFGTAIRDGYQRFEIVVEPKLAFLRHNSDYKIFQQKSAIDIAKAIFAEHGITDYRAALSSQPPKRPYCVQFGETDLDFVLRLLREEGIFFYFEHSADKHTLVMANDATGYGPAAKAPLVYASATTKGPALAQAVTFGQDMIDKKIVHRRFDFTAPTTPVDGPVTSALTLASASSGWEHFEYGQDERGEAREDDRSKQDVDASDARAENVTGRSTEASLVPGGRIQISSELHGELKLLSGGAFSSTTFAVVSVDHHLIDPSYFATRPDRPETEKATYDNTFTAIPATRAYRPEFRAKKPLARGPQTATVVGPKDNEVHTDEHGRIRVQFHWDRVGKKDAESSCFLRVAQGWAGNGWGLQFVPRVGMEVVVDFLEGDPDQPLVTGVLYNGANKPPFPLPSEMNKSGLRTRSTTKGSTEAFSELSFDDTKDAEKVRLHAQKDFEREVENDDSLTVGHDQTRTIKNDRKTTVSEGNDTLVIEKGKRSVTVNEGDDELSVKKGNLSVDLDKGDMDVTLAAGNLKETATSGTVTIEAGRGITLKCGSSTIEIKPQGVTIDALMVTVKAKTKAELSGLMVDVKSSGITQINGSLVKIN